MLSIKRIKKSETFSSLLGFAIGLLTFLCCQRFSQAADHVVDASTMNHKMMFGYQGWFAHPKDGSPLKTSWYHYSKNRGDFTIGAENVELWPDTSEYDADELYPTHHKMSDGSYARLYSAYNPKTIDRHFSWMKNYGIDGVYLQRFLNNELLASSEHFEFRNGQTKSIIQAAEKQGRVYGIMYDVSGYQRGKFVEEFKKDWIHLVDDLGVLKSTRQIRHRGKPVVAIWGMGFYGNDISPEQAIEVIQWLKSQAPVKYQTTVLGGVPTHWRTLTADSRSDQKWAQVYRSFDLISPWTVGRYSTIEGATQFAQSTLSADIAEAKKFGIDYLPVVFPGFSWKNLFRDAPFNSIPRQGGRFWWNQFFQFSKQGATMFYGAMFDEIDEGTAMYKVAPHLLDAPTTGRFLTLNQDGETLPSDWYLQIAGSATQALRDYRDDSSKQWLELYRELPLKADPVVTSERNLQKSIVRIYHDILLRDPTQEELRSAKITHLTRFVDSSEFLKFLRTDIIDSNQSEILWRRLGLLQESIDSEKVREKLINGESIWDLYSWDVLEP